MASPEHGKPITGIGVKPDDKYTLPLSKEAHDRQHSIGEPLFWAELGIEPVSLCLKIYGVSGNQQAALKIVRAAIRAGESKSRSKSKK